MGFVETDQTRPRVTLPQGTIVGVVQTKPDFPQPVDCFLGFPYAQPPIGDLRFRPPRKLESSTDVFDASQYGAAGPGEQLIPPRIKLHFSEDCLSANVFRPQGQPDQLLPVLIYIHGGAWNRGSSAMQDTASMVAWSEAPFVAVSFNYRLGALGFLASTKAFEAGACNLGLKDQILLLEWVQESIHHFGGDKDNVTIMGLSAGGHSGRYHYRPTWEAYTPGRPRIMIFGKDNRELIGGGAGTPAEMIDDTWAREQCQFWWDRTELTIQENITVFGLAWNSSGIRVAIKPVDWRGK